jgi:hypothetical protein
MSNRISAAPQANPYPSLSPSAGTSDNSGSATPMQEAAAQTSDSVTLSGTAQFHALCQRSGLKVEGGTLGQLFFPAFSTNQP